MLRSFCRPLALASFGLLSASSAAAGQLETIPTPISIAAEPALVVLGGEVELTGSSIRLKDLPSVTVSVRAPAGTPTTSTLELDEEGGFAMTFRVEAPGEHTVTATSPDGKESATASFTAAAPGTVSERALTAAATLLEVVREQPPRIAAAVEALPVSPPRQKLEERLQRATEKLAESPDRLREAREAMGELDAILERHPDAYPEVASLYETLAEVEEAAAPLADDLAEQVERLALGITDCDRIDMAGEALSFLGLALSLIGNASQVAIGLLADKTFSARVSARVPALAESSQAKFAFDNSVKHSVTLMQGFETWRGGVHGYVVDLATFAAQETFGVYCEKLEGPFEARFHLEYHEGNQRWLAYDVELTGVLFLRYEKEAGSPTPLTGEFEGLATFSKPWEDLIVLEPGFRPHVFARMSKPPALSPVPYLPEGGKLGRAALGMMGAVPGYFRVPVEGLLDDDRLTLKILPAAQDYADRVVGMVAYVLWSPQVLIPQVKKFDVGYQGAHYILSRGTHTERGTSDEPFTLDVEVDAPNGVARIRRTFERREEEPGSYLLTWEIDLTACNPACRY